MKMKAVFYDRRGSPISVSEFEEAFEDIDKVVLDRTFAGDLEISTVWTGVDLSLGERTPKIFETSIFRVGPLGRCGFVDVAERYATEAQARDGHKRWSESAKAAAQAGVAIDSVDQLDASPR